MANLTILVTHREVPQAGLDILSRSCKLVFCESLPPKRSEILEKAKGVDGILWATHEPLNGEVLDAAGPNLKAISTMSADLDFVDISTLKSRRMPLGYTPDLPNSAIATLAVGLMISAGRRFREGRIKVETGHWETYHLQWMLGQEVKGGIIGFLGFSELGQTIATRLQGFDTQKFIYTSDKDEPDASDYKAEKVSFEDLLKQSDFIFITCPLTKETKGKFNAAAFNQMKPTSVLINVSNGEIVDQDALYDALKTQKIFAAGIDETTPEPLPKTSKLLQLSNLIVTPNLGSSTKRTIDEMAVIAAHNVIQGIAGEPMFAPAYILPPEKTPEVKS
ncbi:unnamed protein product [Hermetia illucens]|uniref:Glyoxylate reductase/hydroxypyruvate reductase n=1 Tax=Hermetia illucens TaxID=343691 RepID=A0A7R8UG55_HERIL|nr:glyoxylate reductase/hydroxypyruvate reductase-like [Hermetia illucens]XP_037917565.1 glyoxylate reductase/hydroxypyruvate reductase-like [Hermetia illucens]CAD7079959.1 unnamed protein product [Hermetia illucens]CAD7088523.1 unnamed protein product [Hermetia illucens]